MTFPPRTPTEWEAWFAEFKKRHPEFDATPPPDATTPPPDPRDPESSKED